jgi:hypothetical protein
MPSCLAALAAVAVLMAAPCQRLSHCADMTVRMGSVQTGSGALPDDRGGRWTEEASVGTVERTRLQSDPAGGGDICKGLYAFSWRHVVSFVGP